MARILVGVLCVFCTVSFASPSPEPSIAPPIEQAMSRTQDEAKARQWCGEQQPVSSVFVLKEKASHRNPNPRPRFETAYTACFCIKTKTIFPFGKADRYCHFGKPLLSCHHPDDAPLFDRAKLMQEILNSLRPSLIEVADLATKSTEVPPFGTDSRPHPNASPARFSIPSQEKAPGTRPASTPTKGADSKSPRRDRPTLATVESTAPRPVETPREKNRIPTAVSYFDAPPIKLVTEESPPKAKVVQPTGMFDQMLSFIGYEKPIEKKPIDHTIRHDPYEYPSAEKRKVLASLPAMDIGKCDLGCGNTRTFHALLFSMEALAKSHKMLQNQKHPKILRVKFKTDNPGGESDLTDVIVQLLVAVAKCDLEIKTARGDYEMLVNGGESEFKTLEALRFSRDQNAIRNWAKRATKLGSNTCGITSRTGTYGPTVAYFFKNILPFLTIEKVPSSSLRKGAIHFDYEYDFAE